MRRAGVSSTITTALDSRKRSRKEYTEQWALVASMVERASVLVANGTTADEQHKDTLAELEEVMKTAVKGLERSSAHERILDKIVRRVTSGEESGDLGQWIDSQLKAASAEADQKALKGDRYKKYRQAVWQVQHPGELWPEAADMDLVELPKDDSLEALVCPITRATLEGRVKKNRTCGHSYSEAGINNYLRQNGRNAACPVAGCAASITQLETDEDMERRVELARRRKREQAREAQDLSART